MIKENILEMIGNTPIVKINNINPNKDVNLYAKVEYFNPSGSVKDRMSIGIIEVRLFLSFVLPLMLRLRNALVL